MYSVYMSFRVCFTVTVENTNTCTISFHYLRYTRSSFMHFVLQKSIFIIVTTDKTD